MKKAFASLALLLVCLLFASCAAQPEAGEDPVGRRRPESSFSSEAAAEPVSEPSLSAEKTEPEAEPEPTPAPFRSIEPMDRELVCLRDAAPEFFVDLRYAGTNNFTGQAIYDFSDAWLRYGTVKKLLAAQESLSREGFGLLIWDAYRPVSAQYALWAAVPDPVYVADPTRGHSLHANGGTVDLTLVYADGTQPEMPTDFDDFSALADRNYGDVSDAAAANAAALENALYAAGFSGYSAEWWHFSDRTSYPFDDLEAIPFSMDRSLTYTVAPESGVDLYAAPSSRSEVLERLPQGTAVRIVGWIDEYCRIETKTGQGYLRPESLVPLNNRS